MTNVALLQIQQILETAIAPHTSFLSVAPVLDTLKLSILYLIMFNAWRVPDPDSLLITKPPDLKNTQMSNFFKYSKILETAIAPHTSFLSVAPVLDTLKLSILYLTLFNG
jgi:hypothetical protein